MQEMTRFLMNISVEDRQFLNQLAAMHERNAAQQLRAMLKAERQRMECENKPLHSSHLNNASNADGAEMR